MKLFLWGAPCASTEATQWQLAERGYHVRSLADVKAEHRPAAPREVKKNRALDIVQCDAVVLDFEGDREELRRCAVLCQELGVRMVLSDQLPTICPIELDNTELLDAIDMSYATSTHSTKRTRIS